MNYTKLHLAIATKFPKYSNIKFSDLINPFGYGAHWMFLRMQELNLTQQSSLPHLPWNLIGLLKYALVAGLSLGISYLLYAWNSLFCFAFPFIFYLLELPFVFLFPLLIQEGKFSLRKGLAYSCKLGFINSYWMLIRIAMGMMIPSRNFMHWQRGCLAIILWYEKVATR